MVHHRCVHVFFGIHTEVSDRRSARQGLGMPFVHGVTGLAVHRLAPPSTHRFTSHVVSRFRPQKFGRPINRQPVALRASHAKDRFERFVPEPAAPRQEPQHEQQQEPIAIHPAQVGRRRQPCRVPYPRRALFTASLRSAPPLAAGVPGRARARAPATELSALSRATRRWRCAAGPCRKCTEPSRAV